MTIHTDKLEVDAISKAMKTGTKYKSNSNVEHFYIKKQKSGQKK